MKSGRQAELQRPLQMTLASPSKHFPLISKFQIHVHDCCKNVLVQYGRVFSCAQLFIFILHPHCQQDKTLQCSNDHKCALVSILHLMPKDQRIHTGHRSKGTVRFCVRKALAAPATVTKTREKPCCLHDAAFLLIIDLSPFISSQYPSIFPPTSQL